MSIDLNPELYTSLALDLELRPLDGFPDHFFILDCETTGGRPTRDRMTELAFHCPPCLKLGIRAGLVIGPSAIQSLLHRSTNDQSFRSGDKTKIGICLGIFA